MLNMIVNPQKLLQISNILNSNVRISHVKWATEENFSYYAVQNILFVSPT
jgi:hypothetical protein